MFCNRRALFTLLLGLLCGALIGCSDKPQAATSTIRLSTSKNVWCALPLIADDQGFFREEGLKVTVDYTDGGRYCMDSVLSNSADVGTIVETNLAYLGYTGSKDIVVVANIVKSNSVAIVARKSSGIATIADLSGKKLGYVPGMQGEIFAHRVLKKHHIDIQSVEVTKMQPKAIPAALDAGDIDAASTWEPFVYSCTRALRDDAIVFQDPEAHTGYMHLAARPQWVQANPDALKAFLRALKKAEEFVQSRPSEAKEILAKKMNVEPEIVEAIWKYFDIRLTCDSREIIDAIKAEGAWVKESDDKYRGKALPNYSLYVAPGVFNSAFEVSPATSTSR